MRREGLSQVLVTGAGSGVGSSIACSLARSGVPVIANFRSPTSTALRLRECAGVTLLQGDLLDDSFLATLPSDPCAVVHCAAATDSQVDSEFFDANVSVVRRLIQHFDDGPCRTWIQLSSVSVHGVVTGGLLNEKSGFTNPSSYGLTKRSSEILLESASSLESVHCLRLPSVLAPGARTHWIARLMAMAQLSETVTLFNPRSTFNNTIHIDDLCSFIGRLLDKERAGYDAYPLASREPVAVIDIVRRVLDVAGSSSRISIGSGEGTSFIIDDSHARRAYGYESRTTMEAIEDFVRQRVMLNPDIMVSDVTEW
jgi:nucleoside-diphosphate-sugar epimerase